MLKGYRPDESGQNLNVVTNYLDASRLEAYADSTLDPEAKLLRTYIGEAEFYFGLLKSNLTSTQGKVFEVGSGVGLLAMLASSLGVHVLAFEPESAGFGNMQQMNFLLRRAWCGPSVDVDWIYDRVGENDPRIGSPASFAYAINVIEHVPLEKEFFRSVMSNLRPGGSFRFICPNYSLPYEPHFEIPTLWNKRVTELVLGRKIRSSSIPNALEMWDELSWPTVGRLTRLFREMNLEFEFGSEASERFLRRPFEDQSFIERKGKLLGSGMRLVGSVLQPSVRRLPAQCWPMIDCTVYN